MKCILINYVCSICFNSQHITSNVACCSHTTDTQILRWSSIVTSYLHTGYTSPQVDCNPFVWWHRMFLYMLVHHMCNIESAWYHRMLRCWCSRSAWWHFMPWCWCISCESWHRMLRCWCIKCAVACAWWHLMHDIIACTTASHARQHYMHGSTACTTSHGRQHHTHSSIACTTASHARPHRTHGSVTCTTRSHARHHHVPPSPWGGRRTPRHIRTGKVPKFLLTPIA